MNMDRAIVADMRISYDKDILLEDNAPSSPFPLFEQWFASAKDSMPAEAEVNAVALATASKTTGRPSCRMVLLKGFDERGFVFYTNYESRKATDLDGNPFAAMTFWWGQRSVRVEGKVVKLAAEESDAYYASRPLGSRIGAWSSPQSKVLPDGRKMLDSLNQTMNDRFKTNEPSRPSFWGGYRIVPDSIEFWQGRPSRLHDRLQYNLDELSNKWSLVRLAP